MHRLVYYSENRISGSQDEIRHQIDEILAASRRNNDVVGVTGALMFSSGFFGQVLEGPSEAVEATFERIQQDVRHGEVHLLEFARIETRNFSNWSMAYVGDPNDAIQGWGEEDDLSHGITGEALLMKLREMVSKSTLAG